MAIAIGASGKNHFAARSSSSQVSAGMAQLSGRPFSRLHIVDVYLIDTGSLCRATTGSTRFYHAPGKKDFIPQGNSRHGPSAYTKGGIAVAGIYQLFCHFRGIDNRNGRRCLFTLFTGKGGGGKARCK